MFLYACTIFLSAFLLFQIQPMIAKMILPWFGGSAAVWTTCLLFFQVELLLGYLYAYWSIRRLTPKRQALLHVALLATSVFLLPITPAASWKPTGAENPTWRILALLAVSVGLPYFLLSTTGPLLQAWLAADAQARKRADVVPYRLYALSNAGSMLALITYPVLVEPFLAARHQAQAWSAAFAVFILICAVVAFRTSSSAILPLAISDTGSARPPGGSLHMLWMALAACGSTLLLAVTNHLSQNVAAIPFLWVLPLSIYLLTFILCFEGKSWYRRGWFLRLLAVALAGMSYAMNADNENLSMRVVIPLFSAGLFMSCMVCHGELARLKPHPRYLTSFYLMISVGGALGGVFVGLIAPHLFPAYFEMPLAIVACAALLLLVLSRETLARSARLWKQPAWLGLLLLTIGLAVAAGHQIRAILVDTRVVVRNFYGGLRVNDTDTARKLTHGTINHGEQYLDPAKKDEPTTYYGRHSGVGLALLECQRRLNIRVGVIGLGTGTLAAYGRPGDYFRFYEINPLVIRIAKTQFTFLKDCRAKVEIALGDARLSLEREPSQNFDLLAVDAFSSDSIPVHLLTKEAFQIYFRHLKADGVVAVHVSNRYLDLPPVVECARRALGKEALLVDSEDEEDTEVFGATWVLVTNHRDFFDEDGIRAAGSAVEPKPAVRLWTDDYSNLFQILK